MDPPSYEDAIAAPERYPPPTTNNPPAPRYQNTVTSQPDPFPLLLLSDVSQTVTVDHHGNRVHALTQIGLRNPDRHAQRRERRSPRPVPITPTYLRDSPGLVSCPRCHQRVTTKVAWKPSKQAWCLCCMLAMFGMICGCCLVPLFQKIYQNVHHSCPHCEKKIYIYKRIP